MAAAPKKNLGKMPCPCCGDLVALKESATGKLSYTCQDADCESTGYADKTSGAARKWMAKLTKAPESAVPAAPAPAQKAPPARQAAPGATKTPAPTPAPPAAPPKAPRPAFDLGALG